MKPDIYTEGDFRYRISADGSAEICGYSGEAATLTIPPVLGGRRVTSIRQYAFMDCMSLEEVTLPEGIVSIGNSAFSNCGYLNSVTLPKGLVSIGNCAFRECLSLTYMDLPEGLVSIGDYAFDNCSCLLGIMGCLILPDSVREIGCNPFSYCLQLTEIEASSDSAYFESIDGVLFSKPDRRLITYPCNSEARSYTVPDGVQAIGECAFFESQYLTAVTLPEGVTSIGRHAFWYSRELESITLPASLCSIDDSAFEECPNLTASTAEGSFAESYCKENNIKTRLYRD